MGGGAARGTQVFATYTTYGDERSERWHPRFHYFGMQWLQVTGLPEGYVPTRDTVTGLQIHADVPVAGLPADLRRPDQPRPPHGPLLDHEQRHVDLHGLPRP